MVSKRPEKRPSSPSADSRPPTCGRPIRCMTETTRGPSHVLLRRPPSLERQGCSMILITNGYVRTMDADHVYPNGYVLISAGKILEVGEGLPAQDIRSAAGTVVDAHGGWVLPGWVDAHNHI